MVKDGGREIMDGFKTVWKRGIGTVLVGGACFGIGAFVFEPLTSAMAAFAGDGSTFGQDIVSVIVTAGVASWCIHGKPPGLTRIN